MLLKTGYRSTQMIIIRTRNPKPWFLVGLFSLCMCTLMMQIIETRILSVISYYYLAFLSISMAMFGMTAGSLFVYFQERWFPAERLFENWSGYPAPLRLRPSFRHFFCSRPC